MTLFCYVSGASGPVSYRWSSTAQTYDSSILAFYRKVVLTASDAGVYTCTARDSDGTTAQNSIEIKFNGEFAA